MYMYILAFSCSGYTLIYLPPPPPNTIVLWTYNAIDDLIDLIINSTY